MAKHKHYDVIVAWAEGKQIEYYDDTLKEWLSADIPLFNSEFNYRVKPKPAKPDYVYYSECSPDKGKLGRELISDKEMFSHSTFRPRGRDNLKLTFDGETGKLKLAEVIHD